MRKFFFLLFVLASEISFAQNSFEAVVRDSSTNEILPGATVVIKGTTNAAAAGADGLMVLKGIPDGSSTLVFSFIGYAKKEMVLRFPLSNPKEVFEVKLSAEGVSVEEVTVSTTRTRSRISDLPVKMEVIGAEDLNEESSVEPENIGSILGDVAGIQWQQTSAVSGNSNIRIQGLSGRYTQILRDGLPVYEGFSGSFGVLDIPPLDLKQAEIIKGSASTLYGGGAIGGLINLISKEPADSVQTVFSLNQTTLKETNLNIFSSGKRKKSGYTVLAGGTFQKAVDVDGDGFSDQPEMNSILVHPRLFLYLNKKTQMKVGVSGIYESHNGGDIQVIDGKNDPQHRYFEKNLTSRASFDADLSAQSGKQNLFSAKGVTSFFDRDFKEAGFGLHAHELSSYFEVNYLLHGKKNDLVGGAQFTSSLLTIDQVDKTVSADQGIVFIKGYQRNTAGLFFLDDWKILEMLTIETGLRADFNNEYGSFILPHASVLLKASKSITTRISGGLGYKLPDIFSGADEEVDLSRVVPLSSSVKPERSAGANADVNYNHLFGNVSVTLNESVFYTKVDHPVSTRTSIDGEIIFGNFDDYLDSKGSETYARIGLEHFDFYLGYVYAQSRRYSSTGIFEVPLNARHKFAVDGLYEIENSWKFGLEATYSGRQYINEIETRPGYPFVAAMIQKTIRKFLITLNCENLFDYRQSRVEDVVLPPYSEPTFRPVWAPLEGRILNLAIRFNL